MKQLFGSINFYYTPHGIDYVIIQSKIYNAHNINIHDNFMPQIYFNETSCIANSFLDLYNKRIEMQNLNFKILNNIV